MKRKTHIKPRVSYFTLDRLYRVLPFFFLAMAGLNVWFLYSYVRSDRVQVELEKEKLLSSVSNAYSFVMHSLSNQIEEVRFRNAVISRPVSVSASASFTNASLSLPSVPVTNIIRDVQTSISPERLSCWYSSVHGVPCVTFGDCHYYVQGDDFGFGSIDKITRLFVFCGGVRYRLAEPPISPLPRFDSRLVSGSNVTADIGVINHDRIP